MNSDKKVVVITGCSSGIGFYTALKFARNGFYTFASVRDMKSEGITKLKAAKEKEQLSLECIALDITNDTQIMEAVSSIQEKTKKIDIVINNAGFGSLGPVEEFSIDEVKAQYDTNVFGMLRMIKAVLPFMREQKSGLIINISSINGLLAFPLWGVYASSKYAIEALTESLRFEVAPFGIKVAIVEPGSFLTDFPKKIVTPKAMNNTTSPYKSLTDTFFTNYYKMEAKAKKNKLLSQLLTPEKVADVIYSVAINKKPKLRYKVGLDTHLYLFFRGIASYSLWNNALKKIYKW